jgi:hypothetical protein
MTCCYLYIAREVAVSHVSDGTLRLTEKVLSLRGASTRF